MKQKIFGMNDLLQSVERVTEIHNKKKFTGRFSFNTYVKIVVALRFSIHFAIL